MIGATGSINRANTYKWMSFLATNIYESVLRSEYASRYTTGSDADEVKAAAHRDIDRWWHILDEALHQTDGVDVWYARLMEAGADVEGEPHVLAQFNIYACFVRDPNGYRIEFQQFL